MNAKVEKFLLALPESKQQNALLLREIFLSCSPNITESIKWNNLTFSCNGDIAFIYTYKQVAYLNIGFFKAVQLTDPKNRFEGTGGSMRHIKITTEKDIPVAQLKKWIKESITLNSTALKEKVQKKK
ncbi:MAG: DUF1801 domain-containing protein [Bacteroidia bacterium]|nr:DUF1801 domain-containing protein [Bacteroidia bacterium]